MNLPPDHIGFDLVPNDDQDPQREAEATKAVQAAIILLAKQHGLTISEEPGAIEADAQENPQRAEKIANDVKPQLVKATSEYQKAVVEEEYYPDGKLKRRAEKIVHWRGKISVCLAELRQLIDACTEWIDGKLEIAAKVVDWVREKVRSRRR